MGWDRQGMGGSRGGGCLPSLCIPKPVAFVFIRLVSVPRVLDCNIS